MDKLDDGWASHSRLESPKPKRNLSQCPTKLTKTWKREDTINIILYFFDERLDREVSHCFLSKKPKFSNFFKEVLLVLTSWRFLFSRLEDYVFYEPINSPFGRVFRGPLALGGWWRANLGSSLDEFGDALKLRFSLFCLYLLASHGTRIMKSI